MRNMTKKSMINITKLITTRNVVPLDSGLAKFETTPGGGGVMGVNQRFTPSEDVFVLEAILLFFAWLL
jgi:hypothetical protein